MGIDTHDGLNTTGEYGTEGRAARGTPSGVVFKRHFTTRQETLDSVLSSVVYEKRVTTLKNRAGKVVWSNEKEGGFRVPKFWSQLAGDIVAEKYSRKRGVNLPNGRESGVDDVIRRITRGISERGWALGYFSTKEEQVTFEAELAFLQIHQYGAFNSPVWFNVGLHLIGAEGGENNWKWHPNRGVWEPTTKADNYQYPQASACFILRREDTLKDIFKGVGDESQLFKGGSGAGSNFSRIRGENEPLSGGGKSSGLLKFLKVYDSGAGATKSGGTTRRAAKMVCLDVDHPDIVPFVKWKAREEYKAQVLLDAGIGLDANGNPDFNGEAYETVGGQNANNSIRVTDDFMRKATGADPDPTFTTHYRTTGEVCETLSASLVLDEMAKAAWACGCPGIQYDTYINRMNTCAGTDKIYASNPCQPGFATVLTPGGIRTFDEIEVGSTVWSGQGWTRVVRKVHTGVKSVYRHVTRGGEFLGTEEHRVFQEGVRVQAQEATGIDVSVGPSPSGAALDLQDVMDGWVIGDGSSHSAYQGFVYLNVGQDDLDVVQRALGNLVIRHRPGINKYAWEVLTSVETSDLPPLPERRVPGRFREADSGQVRGFLRGLYAANGSVCGGRVTLKAASIQMIRDAQEMLSSIGIRSYYTVNKSKEVQFSNGIYECKQSYDLNITHDRRRFAELVGFIHPHKAEKLAQACQMSPRNWSKTTYEIVEREYLGDFPVWDIEVQAEEHSYWTGGLLVSNCSEFMFLDDTACNLASLNLTKFLHYSEPKARIPYFDFESYGQGIDIFIVAQDILVSMSSYPTKEIAKNSEEYRPLGLGYANLGSLLLHYGYGYGTPEAQYLTACVTAYLTGRAYRTSRDLAGRLGPFAGYEANKDSMAVVIGSHIESAKAIKVPEGCETYLWEASRDVWMDLDSGRHDGPRGFRNSQVTVLAPTGTIGLAMDCETTGIEPFLAFKMYKLFAGGQYREIVLEDSIKAGLAALGISENYIKGMVRYFQKYGHFNKYEEKVQRLFLTSLPNKAGKSLHWMDHLRMMAAAQPFLSGAISKTVNMPNETPWEEIREAYIAGWQMNLKAVAIYRDGCKASQPLTTSNKTKKRGEKVQEAVPAIGEAQEKAVQTFVGTQATHTRVKMGHTAINRTDRYKLRIGGQEVYLHVGKAEDGRPLEIFLRGLKTGGDLIALLDSWCISTSIAMQYGAPLEDLVEKFTFIRFAPHGAVQNHARIKFSTSIIDLVFRVIAVEYLGRTDLGHVDPEEAAPTEAPTPSPTPVSPKSLTRDSSDAPFCDKCGHKTVRNGACYKCLNCGESLGCS